MEEKLQNCGDYAVWWAVAVGEGLDVDTFSPISVNTRSALPEDP